MFATVYFPYLRNADTIEFVDIVIERVKTFAPQPLPVFVQKPFDALVNRMDEIRVLHKMEKGSEETDNMRLSDALRGKYAGVTSRLWSVLADFPAGPVQEAGKTLERHFGIYAPVRRLTQQAGMAESADTKRILANYTEDPELRSALEAVPFARPLIEAWGQSNAAYTAAFNQRSNEQVEEEGDGESVAIKTLRKDLPDLFTDLLEAVWSAYLHSEKSEVWSKVVLQIENAIDAAQRMIAQRQAQAEAKKEAQPEA